MNNPFLRPALQRQVDALPRELSPHRDLWLGIAHELARPTAPRYWRHVAMAAVVLLTFGVGAYFGFNQPGLNRNTQEVESYISSLRLPHEESKQALLVQFREDQAVYPEWPQQMQELEQAERLLYQTIRNDPGNRELLKILRDVQTKQLKLIDAAFRPQLNTI